MSLNDQVGADIAAAMKARDSSRLSALRMLKAAIMNKGVEKGRDLEDAEVLQVIASLRQKRTIASGEKRVSPSGMWTLAPAARQGQSSQTEASNAGFAMRVARSAGPRP